MMRLTALCLLSICAAAAADVTGKWNVTATAPSGREVKVQLELKEEGGKLAGTMSNADGSIAIENVMLEGGRLSYTLPAGGGYRLTFAVADGSMKGNYTGPDGTTGPAIATRSVAATNVAGHWKGQARTSTGREFSVELELSVSGGRILGTVSAPEGSADIENARLEGDNLTFEVTTDDGVYRVKTAVKGDEMSGSYNGPAGESGTFTLRR